MERKGTGCNEKNVKFVGIHIDDKLDWTEHIRETKSKLAKTNSQLACVRNFLPLNIKKMIYNTLFSSTLQYGLVIWGSATKTNIKSLQTMQNYAVRNVGSSLHGFNTDQIYRELDILKLEDLFELQIGKFVIDYINNEVPASLKCTNYIKPQSEIATRPLSARNGLTLHIEVHDEEWLNKFPPAKIPKVWENFPSELKGDFSYKSFKHKFSQTRISKYTT